MVIIMLLLNYLIMKKKIQNDRLAQKLKVENNIVDMSSGGISMFEEEGE